MGANMNQLKIKQIYFELKDFLLNFFSVVGIIYLFSNWTGYPWEQKYILLFSFIVSIITLLVDEKKLKYRGYK